MEGGRSSGKADPVKELMPWGVINCNSLANICRLLELCNVLLHILQPDHFSFLGVKHWGRISIFT